MANGTTPSFLRRTNLVAFILCHLLTEYRPNVATGNILPGVSLVRAINPLSRYYAAQQEKIQAAKVQAIPKETADPGIPTEL